ncbi:MAG TPA: hypothetical protein VNJ08_13065 [Bacteriovoracaceae bacterium]|nr:hypothetical protein [Bacteriovoracaceae bacterium]
MLKLCSLILLLTTSTYSLARSNKPITYPHHFVQPKNHATMDKPKAEEAKVEEDPGPTLPLIKEVHNAEERRIHLGVNMGINSPEGTRGATPEFGIDVGFQPLIPFGLSFELSTSRFDSSHDEMHRRVTALVRGTYNFGGDTPVIKYSYFGLATGAVMLHDGAEMGLAPLFGFDVPLYGEADHSCSLGFMAKYLFVTSKDPDSLMTSAALKYWF